MPAVIREKKHGTPRLPKLKSPPSPPPQDPPALSAPASPLVRAVKEDSAKQSQTPPATASPHASTRPATARKMITVKDAAFRLGKSEDAIYKWLRTGRLRGLQLGGARCWIQVDEKSVEELIESSLIAECRSASAE